MVETYRRVSDEFVSVTDDAEPGVVRSIYISEDNEEWRQLRESGVEIRDVPDVTYSANISINNQVHTSNGTPAEIFRLDLQPKTGYTGIVTIIGTDSVNGNVRVIRASFAVKRLAAGAVSIGGAVVLANHADTGAAAWAISTSVQGNTAVISVQGAANRPIDWLIRGDMVSFSPEGVIRPFRPIPPPAVPVEVSRPTTEPPIAGRLSGIRPS